MLPISTKDIVTFRPIDGQIETLEKLLADAADDKARDGLVKAIADLREKADSEPQPVFRLGVASHFQRAAFRRDLTASGATYPGEAALSKAMREAIDAANPVNRDELLALIDEFDAANPGDIVDPDALNDLETIVRIARAMGGRFPALEGDRIYWLDVAPIIACRHFLLGWEGVKTEDGTDAPFDRRGGLTTDETLQHLEENDLKAVGYKIMTLMRPTKAQEKNSVSPSQSHDGRKPSLTETKLLTEANGTSSVSATGETPATC
ncbi:hypothetical protein [Azospirillum himalayense]|uniref:Uncharacterized protein n=1 Tax=Azospirillum himalayense TaxID=654847 RepID=A0ABW0GBY7_9PROT